MCFQRLSWVVLSWLVIGIGSVAVAQDTDAEDTKENLLSSSDSPVSSKKIRGTERRSTRFMATTSNEGRSTGWSKTIEARRKTDKGPDAGAAWMIVGLLESLRGQDAAAVAPAKAEKLATENYLASYYLGQSLVLVGQPDKAAEALERSIQRKPAQADLLDVYQAVGVYQRAQKTDKALDVWNRLEKQFPNDAHVQEQIATTLLEENEFAAALPAL